MINEFRYHLLNSVLQMIKKCTIQRVSFNNWWQNQNEKRREQKHFFGTVNFY